jgi:hypothetical protein
MSTRRILVSTPPFPLFPFIAVLCVVGSKLDLVDGSVPIVATAEEYAKGINGLHSTTSAKENIGLAFTLTHLYYLFFYFSLLSLLSLFPGIEETFVRLAQQVLERRHAGNDKGGTGGFTLKPVDDYEQGGKSQKKCCK